MSDHYIRKTLRQNRWTVGYIAFLLTILVVLEVLDAVEDFL